MPHQTDIQRDRAISQGIGASPLVGQAIQRRDIEQTRSLGQALGTSRAILEQQRQQRQSRFAGQVAKNRAEVSRQLTSSRRTGAGAAEGDRSNSIFFTPETGGFEAVGASGRRLSSAGTAAGATFDIGGDVSQAIRQRQESGIFGETVNLVVPSQAAANDPRIQKILRESPGKINLIIRPGGGITRGRGGGGGITGFFKAAQQAAGIVTGIAKQKVAGVRPTSGIDLLNASISSTNPLKLFQHEKARVTSSALRQFTTRARSSRATTQDIGLKNRFISALTQGKSFQFLQEFSRLGGTF